MKRLTICLTFLSFLTGFLSAQEKVTVEAGKNIQDYFTPEETYLYRNFEPGIVIFKDGNRAEAKLNYNIVLGQMLFLQSPKDTLAIGNPEKIFFVAVKSDTFYYWKGYHQLVETGFGKYLTKKQYVKVEDVRKGGAYGTTSSLSATNTISSYSDQNNQRARLTENQEFVVARRNEFFISNSKGRYWILSKQNVMKLYPKHKNAIQDFLIAENIDFNKEEDAVKLFRFLMKCI
jgi:hypothetical protein